MVVIRDSKAHLASEYGDNFLGRIRDFSEVIGYTVEEDSEEVRVEFNPDRPDLFSFASMNRSMKCFYDKDYWVGQDMKPSGVDFTIDDGVRKLRKYAIAFVAKGSPISGKLDSLIEYQERIHDNLGKNRSKVSIGLHDMDKLRGPFTYKAVGITEIKFTTYDGAVSGTPKEILEKHTKGIDYSGLIPSDKEVPVILDADGDVLSMPPIVNGTKSKVEQSTKNFFIDITGPDRKATRDAYFLLLYEFRNLGYNTLSVKSNGEAFQELETTKFDGRSLQVTQEELIKFTGITIPQKKAAELLRKMGYMSGPSSKWIDVSVPGNRIDVMGSVDVIEDIVKAYGLSNVSEKSMDLPLIGIPDPSNDFSSLLRDAMLGIGMQEVRTFVVSSSQHYNHFKYGGGLEILNPKSLDYSSVRDRLYINILDLLRINKRRALPHKVFEIGEVYNNGEQETRFCATIMDSKASYSSIKQVLDYVAKRLGINSVEVKPKAQEGFIDGRSGEVFLNGKPAGFIGEIDPEVLVRFDISTPVAAMELYVSALMGLSGQ